MSPLNHRMAQPPSSRNIYIIPLKEAKDKGNNSTH